MELRAIFVGGNIMPVYKQKIIGLHAHYMINY
jgi:hypothetical protein